MLEAIALSVLLTGNPDNNGNEGPWYWNGHACTSASDTGMRHGDPIQDRAYYTKEQCEWLHQHPQDSPNPVPPSHTATPAPSDIPTDFPTMTSSPIVNPPVPTDTPTANAPSIPATEAPSWPSQSSSPEPPTSAPTSPSTQSPVSTEAKETPVDAPATATSSATYGMLSEKSTPSKKSSDGSTTFSSQSTGSAQEVSELAYTGVDWGMLLVGSILVALGIGTWTLGRRMKH